MTSGWEPRDDQDPRSLRRENDALRAENLALREACHANARARERAAQDRAQLDEILGSRAWAVVQGARRVAAIVGRRANLRADASAPPSSPHVFGQGAGGRAHPEIRHSLKVSVIIPSYNHAPYLEERLRSIFAQTYPPHEVIFLDDASTDESLAVARRLAAESPVPFRLVLNGANSGSTFRQWLKGIDVARGDLIWIAESDDTCRPGLLEGLVPAFDDPSVMLAYCQSAMIGPDGQPYAADYLAATDDLSPVRWRYPYCVSGREEVELALSQRNTIPNASAVVFRKPAAIEEREDLESLRIGGDWLFYAMRIRRGRVAYVPEPLNGHRHHDGSVRAGFERAIELFEEQLRVKARIFESFPVSATAISASLARGFAEYADRMRGLDPRPAMTEHPRLASHLDRIRSVLDARLKARPGARILVVLSGVTDRSAIRRINAMADRFPVFLCNAIPGELDPVAAVAIDERVIPIEGALGLLPWAPEGEPVSIRRAEVIRELIRFHRINAIDVRGRRAEELIAAIGLDPAIRRLGEIDERAEVPRPVRGSREMVLASRVHGLVLALRDSRKRLAEVERAVADYAAQSASPAWRLGAAIDRLSRRIAPGGSRRRRAIGSAVRIVRGLRGSRRTAESGAVVRDRGFRPPAPEPIPVGWVKPTEASPRWVSPTRQDADRDRLSWPPEKPSLVTSQPSSGRGRILIVDHDVPTPDLDAGSLRIIEIVKTMRGRGNHVAFLPDILSAPPRYVEDLERLGVEVVRAPDGPSVARYLEESGPALDLVILSRPGIAARHVEAVQRLAPRAKTVFDTVDLHYVREWRAARLLGDREAIWEARRRKLQELALVRRCDATLVVSAVEREVLARACPGREIRVLPTIVEVPDEEPPGWEGRRDVVFVGGFRHAPNVDAVVYFVEEILPLILPRVPDLGFHVVGAHAPGHLQELAGGNVRVLGYVPDLTPIFRRALISVAPLRFGAGVKGKVNLSMAHGVPTVVSPVAAEGMHLVQGRDTLIADDPASFADAVVELIRSRELWERLSINGRASVREHFSVEAVGRQIDDLLVFAGIGR